MARAKIGSSCVVFLVVGLVFDSQLQAGVVASATLMKVPAAGIPFEGTEAALGAPWVSFLLSVHSTAGEQIGALYVDIQGPLHQRWSTPDGVGPPERSAAGSSRVDGDSHLLAPFGSLWGSGPDEDNPRIGSPLPSDYLSQLHGVGSFLRGVWTVADASTTADLAYIVVPKGDQSQLDIVVKVLYGYGDPGLYETVVEFDEADFFPIVPEPTSVWLAGLGLAGMSGAIACGRPHRPPGRKSA